MSGTGRISDLCNHGSVGILPATSSAAEAGLPYQTLAASALHMVAIGKLRHDLVKA